jgi:hypothetical protein
MRTKSICDIFSVLGLITALVFSFAASALAQPPGYGLVRLRVDLDSVTVNLNGDLWVANSSTNYAPVGVWTDITLAPGSHVFEFQHPDYTPFAREVTIIAGQTEDIDINFTGKPPESPDSAIVPSSTHEIERPVPEDSAVTVAAGDTVVMNVVTDPDSAEVFVDGRSTGLVGPGAFSVVVGQHLVEVFKEGFEPLSHRIEVAANKSVQVKFSLKIGAPSVMTPESLGMAQMPMMPMRNLEEAETPKVFWNNMAETFAIVPLGQGLVAKLLLHDEAQKGANMLVITGVALTGGSYLLGRFLSSRKHDRIVAQNEWIVQQNDSARIYNRDLNHLVRESNDMAVERWLEENRTRGTVTITEE